MFRIRRSIYLPFLLFTIGLVLVIFGGGWLWEYTRTSEWKVVRGIVISTGTGLIPPSYRYPVIKYGYIVDGSEYVSDRIKLNKIDYIARRESLLKKFTPGRKVNVYVHPMNYNKSVIDRGLPTDVSGFFLAIGFFLILLDAIIMKFLGVKIQRWIPLKEE